MEADGGVSKWQAESLVMKSATNVCERLRRLDRKSALKEIPPTTKDFLKRWDTQKYGTQYFVKRLYTDPNGKCGYAGMRLHSGECSYGVVFLAGAVTQG